MTDPLLLAVQVGWQGNRHPMGNWNNINSLSPGTVNTNRLFNNLQTTPLLQTFQSKLCKMFIANVKNLMMLLAVIGLMSAVALPKGEDSCGDCRNDPSCRHDVRRKLFILVINILVGNACQGSVVAPCGSCSNDPKET